MVGPVLLKQDKTEAVMAVDARLDFIENEMYGPPSNEIEGSTDCMIERG
jgi:chaperonin cofactor prefoldin